MRSRTQFILGGLALALTLVSTSVSAQEPAETIEFRYAQSELSTSSGTEQVYHRLYELVDEICDKEYGRFAPRHQSRKQRCAQDIITEIVDKISDVELKELVENQGKHVRKNPILYSLRTD